MIDFRIGQRYTSLGALITPPAGVIIPRPFDIRTPPVGVVGRGIGGIFERIQYHTMDLVYETTNNSVVTALRARYNPLDPKVWLYVMDHITTEGRWYGGTMLPPHIERIAGSNINAFILPFHLVEPYDA